MSSSNDDAVYAEVHEAAANKFAMDENICYEGIKSSSSNSKRSNIKQGSNVLVQGNSSIKKVFFVLFVIVIALLLGTVCACIAFALEMSNLKASIQMESASRQKEIKNLSEQTTNMLHQQLNLTYSALQQIQDLNAANQLLNIRLDENVHLLNLSIVLSYQQFRQYYSVLENMTQELNMTIQRPGMYSFHPAASCASLPQSTPTGYYWVTSTNGSSVRVYCDMVRSCGGFTGGWAIKSR